MDITFSSINNIPKGADVYLCLADQELHPCFTKRYESEWANKSFHVVQFNDTGIDERYRQVSMEDIEYCANLFKSLSYTHAHIHVNCHAGISRSAAITVLGMMMSYETPTLELLDQCKAMVSRGVCRIPRNDTHPNEHICNLISQYFKLEEYNEDKKYQEEQEKKLPTYPKAKQES